jgi:hypothetical protein
MKRFLLGLAMLCALPMTALASSCGAPAPILQMLQQVDFPVAVVDDADLLQENLRVQADVLAEINPAMMAADERAAFYTTIEAQAAETIAQLRVLASKAAPYDASVTQQLGELAANLEACTTEKRTLLLQALADPATQGVLLERLSANGMLVSFEADCVNAIDTPGAVPYAMEASAFYAQCARTAMAHAARDDAGHFTVMHRVAQPLCQAFGEDPVTLTRTLLAALSQ